MPNLPVSPNWRWPEGPDRANLVSVPFDKLAQLRKDRDELAEALEAALSWVDVLGGKDAMNEPGDARSVLARIRGGG